MNLQMRFVIGLLMISFTGYSQEYFEGKIVYEVEVKLKQENHPNNEYLKDKWGDTLIIYHHLDGFQKRKFLNSGLHGYDWNIYDPERNEYYAKWHNLDTVYYYDCGTSVTDFISLKNGESKQIMDQKCRSIVLESYHPFSKQKSFSKLYYADGLKMDPRNYERFIDSHLNEIYEATKSHIVEWTIELSLCTVRFTAIEIEHIDLANDFFGLPDDIPRKKT